MRVLLVSQAEWSHAAGMVPLGWGLRSAGHDVLFATQPEMISSLASSGLPTIAVGRDHHIGRLLKRVPRQRDLGLTALSEGDAEWSALTWRHTYMVRWWFSLINEPMLNDLVDLCRRWKPDLVIWETTTFAGGIAARSVGARHLRFTWSMDLLGLIRHQFVKARDRQAAKDRVDPLGEWLGRCAERFGATFDEELVSGQATITQMPASLRRGDPETVTYLPVRFVPYNGPTPVPNWLGQPAERRRVNVCLGKSAMERFGEYTCSARDLLTALGDADVEVIATLAGADRQSLGKLPDNIRLEEFVPLDALMPSCAAIINHGGPGTVATAAVYGIPQLVVPAEFDAPILAERLAESGAGIALPAQELEPHRVCDLVQKLLDDPSYAAGAERLRREIHAMPTPASVAHTLTSDSAHHLASSDRQLESAP